MKENLSCQDCEPELLALVDGTSWLLWSPVLKLFATTCISGCGCPNTSEAVATLRCCCPCEKAYASAMAITVTTRTIRNLRRRITRPPTFQRIESPRWPSPSRGRTKRPLP